jgi:hypothetical protein
MKDEKIIKLALADIVHEHTCAIRGFGDGYCFDTKHQHILFEKDYKLRKLQGIQEADRRKMEGLREAIEKRQPEIDRLMLEHYTVENFTKGHLEAIIGEVDD